jgi:hypothetical protein
MNYVETEEIKPWLAKRKALKVKGGGGEASSFPMTCNRTLW